MTHKLCVINLRTTSVKAKKAYMSQLLYMFMLERSWDVLKLAYARTSDGFDLTVTTSVQ